MKKGYILQNAAVDPSLSAPHGLEGLRRIRSQRAQNFVRNTARISAAGRFGEHILRGMASKLLTAILLSNSVDP